MILKFKCLKIFKITSVEKLKFFLCTSNLSLNLVSRIKTFKSHIHFDRIASYPLENRPFGTLILKLQICFEFESRISKPASRISNFKLQISNYFTAFFAISFEMLNCSPFTSFGSFTEVVFDPKTLMVGF